MPIRLNQSVGALSSGALGQGGSEFVELDAPREDVDITIIIAIKSGMANSEACVLARLKGPSSVQRVQI